jgi:hypothetical protein
MDLAQAWGRRRDARQQQPARHTWRIAVMDQLINMVKERAGIDEGQARTAVDTVIGFLKDRLPEPIAGQIDGVIGDGGQGGGSPLDSVGGLFGGSSKG